MSSSTYNRWAAGQPAYDRWWSTKETDEYNAKPQLTDQINNSTDSKLIRPSWKQVYNGYPKTKNEEDDLEAEKVFLSILTEKNYEKNKSILTNACATRVSLGLLNGGMNVRHDYQIDKGKFMGRGFIASAINLKNWLSKDNIWGSADETIVAPDNLNNVASTICQRNGVYIIIGGFSLGISGHASLWIGEKMSVIGGHNYIFNNPNQTIYFWELI